MNTKYCVKHDGTRISEVWLNTYEELLIYLKRSYGTTRDVWSYNSRTSRLEDFTKRYRHNENDGLS